LKPACIRLSLNCTEKKSLGKRLINFENKVQIAYPVKYLTPRGKKWRISLRISTKEYTIGQIFEMRQIMEKVYNIEQCM
jgi:hypothetical protein